MRTLLLAGCALLALLSDLALAQGQFPVREDERIFPHLENVTKLPSWDARRPIDLRAWPVWYLPLGTQVQLKHDRRLLPHSTKYSLGPGPILANQYFHVAPSSDIRVLPASIQYTLTRIEGVHAKATYSPHLLQHRHLVRMVLEAPSGQVLELEICPGSDITPTVAQMADYVEFRIPEVQVLD